MNTNAFQVRHSSIVIPNYDMGDCEKLERLLSVWSATHFRLDPIGYVYDEEKRELRVPRGLDLSYLERILNRPYDMDYKADESDKISLQLKVEPRSDIQRKSISFLTGLGKYEYTKLHSQLTLNLDTGDGKTYCAIAAASFIQTKTIVITHTDTIKQQWIDSFVGMTSIDARSIMNIEGSGSIKKLMKLTKIPHKIFVVNHRTIQSYAKKNGWDAVSVLFKHLRVGLKIFDEAHLEFSNLIRTDMFTNTKKTIYLTATFARSQRAEIKVFDACFKNIARYGRETRSEKNRHIIYVPVMFNSKPDLIDRGNMRNSHGLDKNKYIDYQLDKQLLFDVVEWLTKRFENQSGKTLLLLSKIDAVNRTYDYMTDLFPDKKVSRFHSKVDDKEKETALDADIIVSTPKSLGTGNDIANLRFVIMTEPYSSPVTAEQTSGRLRKLPNADFCFYIEIIDSGVIEAVNMYKRRLPTLKKKCEKVFELKYKEQKS